MYYGYAKGLLERSFLAAPSRAAVDATVTQMTTVQDKVWAAAAPSEGVIQAHTGRKARANRFSVVIKYVHDRDRLIEIDAREKRVRARQALMLAPAYPTDRIDLTAMRPGTSRTVKRQMWAHSVAHWPLLDAIGLDWPTIIGRHLSGNEVRDVIAARWRYDQDDVLSKLGDIGATLRSTSFRALLADIAVRDLSEGRDVRWFDDAENRGTISGATADAVRQTVSWASTIYSGQERIKLIDRETMQLVPERLHDLGEDARLFGRQGRDLRPAAFAAMFHQILGDDRAAWEIAYVTLDQNPAIWSDTAEAVVGIIS